MAKYVESALGWQRDGHSLPFATLERASSRVVGTTRFGNYDAEHRRIEIGWTLVARAWQRTAINTEAKLLMLRHAFERLDLLRVELKTDALNTPSRRAIERLGAVQEGILRQHVVTWSGRVRDTVYYSVIRQEWPAVEARLKNFLA
jgi:RimJ/RimL family protein N-acetyltransferase